MLSNDAYNVRVLLVYIWYHRFNGERYALRCHRPEPRTPAITIAFAHMDIATRAQRFCGNDVTNAAADYVSTPEE